MTYQRGILRKTAFTKDNSQKMAVTKDFKVRKIKYQRHRIAVPFSFSLLHYPPPRGSSSLACFFSSPSHFSRLLSKAVFPFPDAMAVFLPVDHNSMPGVWGNKFCLRVIFLIWVCKTPTVSFKERHRDPLRQIHLSRAVPAPFFKALPRFCTLQIFTYYNTYVLSSRHLRQMAPWQKQPLRKENTPLEPAGKVLNVRSKKQAKEE